MGFFGSQQRGWFPPWRFGRAGAPSLEAPCHISGRSGRRAAPADMAPRSSSMDSLKGTFTGKAHISPENPEVLVTRKSPIYHEYNNE